MAVRTLGQTRLMVLVTIERLGGGIERFSADRTMTSRDNRPLSVLPNGWRFVHLRATRLVAKESFRTWPMLYLDTP